MTLPASSRPPVSVVVPTYNRRAALDEVLAALEAQDEAPPFEVLIVDDGSSDGTSEYLEERSFQVERQILRQRNRGPAAARNEGVRLARGELIAFLGDDTVPARDWLRQHWRAHQSATAVAAREPGSWVGVIGYTAWHRRMRLNPFLRYINEYGLQFGFALIQDPDDVPFNFFYTSNLSLPREALLAEPFDLAFPYAAWEDIEVSYRLKKRGLRLLYAPEAQVQHDHPTHLRRFCERQEKAGYCAVVFYHRHPELAGFLGLGPQGPPPLPSAYRQKVRELLARGLQQLPVSCPRLWEETLRYHYIAGLHRGWREGAGAKGQSPESAGETPCPQSTVLEKVGRG